MHKASFCRGHRDINDDIVDTSTSAELLNRGGGDDENDEMVFEMEQMETPAMAKGKSKVDTLVSSYTRFESMVVTQVHCTTEQLVANEFPTLVTDSLDKIVPFSYEKARTGARFCLL